MRCTPVRMFTRTLVPVRTAAPGYNRENPDLSSVSSASSVVIREARPDDEPHVREFTRHTFHFGDYVGDAFADWLRTGCDVWIAEIDGTPVGIACVDYPTPGEVWFQGLRVHPEYRRRGIGTMLTEPCVKSARQRGAHVARAIIDSDNYRSIGLVTSFGFKQMAERTYRVEHSRPNKQGRARHIRLSRQG